MAMPCRFLMMFALLVCGCGPSGPKRVPVSGNVSYQGQAVTQGDIVFVPSDPSKAPDAGKIIEGQFDALVQVGPCRVEITALHVGPDTPVVMGSPLAENYIPEHYNRESILEVEVSASGENEFEFALSRDPPDG